MNWVLTLFAIHLLLASATASAKEMICPTLHHFLQAMVDPLDDYVEYFDPFEKRRFARVTRHLEDGLELETQFGQNLFLRREQLADGASKRSKAFFYSAMHRIERETDIAIGKTIPFEIETTDIIEGKTVREWVHAEAVRADPYGDALERHAYGLQKKGRVLVISDEATELAGIGGYQQKSVRTRAISGSSVAKQDLIVLPSSNVRTGKLPVSLPHEGSHAQFDHLASKGDGSSFSIRFFDYTPLKKGEKDFYRTYRNLEEHKIWAQDLLRQSRQMPEAEVRPLFLAQGYVSPTKLFDIAQTESHLVSMQKLLKTSRPTLASGQTALIESERVTVEELKAQLIGKRGRLKSSYVVKIDHMRTMNIPINTQTELDLIQKLSHSSEKTRHDAKNKLFKIWNQKVSEQIEITEQLVSKVERVRQGLSLVRKKSKITYEEYQAFRKTLVEATHPVRLRKPATLD